MTLSESAVVVIDTPAATTIDNGCTAVFDAPSVTCTTNEDVPAVVGVPLMTPVAPFSARPADSVPDAIVHVYAGTPPAAARVVVYAPPAVPPGSVVVPTLTAGFVAIDSSLVAVCTGDCESVT